MRLSRLHLNDTASLAELNDPVHFNGESYELMSDVKLCIEYADKMAS